MKKVIRQSVGIPMGANCTPLIADLFFYTAMNLNKWPNLKNLHSPISLFHNNCRYLDDILIVN